MKDDEYERKQTHKRTSSLVINTSMRMTMQLKYRILNLVQSSNYSNPCVGIHNVKAVVSDLRNPESIVKQT